MIQAASLLSLLCAALPCGAGDPPPNGAPLSLAASLAAPGPALPQGVYDAGPPPTGWVSFGINWTSSTLKIPALGDPDEDEPLGGEFGLYTWNGDLGLGLELGFAHSTYKVQVTPTSNDTVDVARGTLGLRLADRGTSHLYTPWARAGLVYRSDNGKILDDSGFGFYLGAGLDWKLLGGVAITPSLTYQDSNSYAAQEWLAGLALTVLF